MIAEGQVERRGIEKKEAWRDGIRTRICQERRVYSWKLQLYQTDRGEWHYHSSGKVNSYECADLPEIVNATVYSVQVSFFCFAIVTQHTLKIAQGSTHL